MGARPFLFQAVGAGKELKLGRLVELGRKAKIPVSPSGHLRVGSVVSEVVLKGNVLGARTGSWQAVPTLLPLSRAVGELLSGSSPPSQFFNPVFVQLSVGLYGCGSRPRAPVPSRPRARPAAQAPPPPCCFSFRHARLMAWNRPGLPWFSIASTPCAPPSSLADGHGCSAVTESPPRQRASARCTPQSCR